MKPRGLPDWPEAAAQLAQALPTDRIHPAVRSWMAGRPPGDRWAVALSGGADSVALLALLVAHWPKRRRHLVALHFDHRLRGAASAADARSCARLCAALGVRLRTGRWPAPPKGAPAAAARAARFAFFDREMVRARATALLLGHHQDDVAESMLMRLARGSGTGGLAAPRPVHRLRLGRRRLVHIRPLLALPKAELVAALRLAGIPWREDASNAGDAHFRNRVRKEVVPAWIRAAGRDAVAGAARSRELLDEDDEALAAWADSLGALKPDRSLDLAAVAGKPRALLRRVLHRWLMTQRVVPALSRQAFEVLLAAVALGRATRQSLGSGQFAVIRQGRLRAQARPRSAARR